MSSFFSEYIFNSTIIEVIQLYWNVINVYISDSLASLRDNTDNKSIWSVFEAFPTSVQFNDYKWTLLKVFTTFLIVNLILIAITWRIYGKRICDRFMNLSKCATKHIVSRSLIPFLSATLQAIEELKASVAKLKLPKEHTPRI